MQNNRTADAADKTQTIMTLIRRGESSAKISAMLGVKRSDVDKVMARFVAKMMA